MISQNKYLKEIGYDENYFLFKKTQDKRYIPNKEGFVEAEFFNLNITFALVIYSHLCYYRDNISDIVIPSVFLFKKNGDRIDECIARKKWENVIDTIIEGFKIKLLSDEQLEDYFNTKDLKEICEKSFKIWRKGAKLFIDYFDVFWY